MGQPWTTEQKIRNQCDRVLRNLDHLHDLLREQRDNTGNHRSVNRDMDRLQTVVDCLERMRERYAERPTSPR